MPLPRNGAPWPPEEHTPHGEAVREWSAWYSGAPEQLEAFYVPRTGAAARPAQFSGGLVGKLARWWWGTPTGDGEQRAKLHVPLAADIAGTSADLLFSEPVRLSGATAKDAKIGQWLDDLQADGLDSHLHESAEICAALGGVFLRVTWDTDVSPRPWTTAIHPDGAVPEFKQGRLHAVTLWSIVAKEGQEVWRHLERHEPGAILHGLYKGTATNIGKAMPLQERPETAGLAPLVNAEGAQLTGTQRLTVSYVPNMLPNRLARHSLQGRSDFQGVTPLFDALDEAYSSWWRDIRVAKSRLHVPAQYLDSDGPGNGATVDIDREVYVPLQGILAKGGDGIMMEAQQFAIRVAEHADTCREWTNTALQSAGYSAATFGDGSDGGMMTATEVQAKERRSYRTRGKKVRYWTAGLRDHLSAMVEVANANLAAGLPTDGIRVEFPDGVQESQLSLANVALALRNAEAASVETRVRMVNPDWDNKRVAAEVAAIHGEAGSGAPDPTAMDPGF